MKNRLAKSLALYCLVNSSSLFAGALFQPFKIVPTDIFNNDSQTRRVAKTDELRWTVSLGGCTGSMLSTKYLITANHCSPSAGSRYTSGGCMVLNCKGDLQAVKVVESFSDLDVSIVEVKWLRTDSAWKQRYAPQIQTKPDEVKTGRDGGGTTKIFTVGFPVDKNGSAMYAEGYAKAKSGIRFGTTLASSMVIQVARCGAMTITLWFLLPITGRMLSTSRVGTTTNRRMPRPGTVVPNGCRV